ncbi:MAG: 5-dehydro-2-deoxygluconokinase [bacterium]|nr:5-dehydro-2-deoxygluconokinase [bacterium]
MPTYDLLCIGRSSLDLFANELGAAFADVKTFSAFVGGSPTNICVAAHRLGLKTVMLTGMGDDYVSQFLLKFLEGEGVETRYIAFKPGFNTNTVLVALQPPEQMQFVAYHANNADLELTFDDMVNAPLADSRVVLFSGMCFLKEPIRSATQFAVEQARQAGAAIYMDLDYRKPMWSDMRTYGITTRLILPLVDVALGTHDELCAAAGVSQIDAAIEALLTRVQEAVVYKQGAEGATVYTVDGGVYKAAPFQVEVVNFLGAGDAFAGGFIWARLNGWGWRKAARLGNACGALIVSQQGTGNAMARLDEVVAFVEANGGWRVEAEAEG